MAQSMLVQMLPHTTDGQNSENIEGLVGEEDVRKERNAMYIRRDLHKRFVDKYRHNPKKPPTYSVKDELYKFLDRQIKDFEATFGKLKLIGVGDFATENERRKLENARNRIKRHEEEEKKKTAEAQGNPEGGDEEMEDALVLSQHAF